MSDANVTIIGNVASDVQSYPINNGSRVSSFRLASQRRYYNRRTGRWVEDPAAFYRVVCWRTLAANVAESVRKGEPVVVHGRLRLNDWIDDDGHRRTDAEVDAWSVGYDLMRGTAVFTRSRRQTQAGDDDDPLDHIRSEQRARAEDDVIVDPDTGEMFSIAQLQRERSDDGSASGDEQNPSEQQQDSGLAA